MEKEAIIEQLEKQKGRAGELARTLIAYREGSGNPRNQAYDELCRFFEEGSPADFGEVFEKGPRELFTAVHGKAVADKAAEAARRLNLYVHSPSTYRRSFRSKELRPYHYRFITILDSLFFSWEDFDFVKDLITPQNDRKTERSERLFPWVYSDFLAVCIDEG
ncbi:MAG: hypothetical protein LBK77_05815, partial [Spirochaetaceae bacterium]|nr:hypothetical protein [Spirochaetaceae bacterium]